MTIEQVLAPETVNTNLQGNDKREIIEELLDILIKAGNVSQREQALEDLLKREEKMSTGIQYGVAIPHAKTSAVDTLAACIGIHKKGIDFNALDGGKSQIFVMTLSPLDRTGPHLQFLAEISKILLSQSVRRKLLKTEKAEDVLAVFRGL